jgi:hypothetical protein
MDFLLSRDRRSRTYAFGADIFIQLRPENSNPFADHLMIVSLEALP